MIWTNLNTFATGSALMVINYGKIVLYMDGIVWAYLLAPFAGDTRVLANLFRDSAFIKGFATHVHHL